MKQNLLFFVLQKFFKNNWANAFFQKIMKMSENLKKKFDN